MMRREIRQFRNLVVSIKSICSSLVSSDEININNSAVLSKAKVSDQSKQVESKQVEQVKATSSPFLEDKRILSEDSDDKSVDSNVEQNLQN